MRKPAQRHTWLSLIGGLLLIPMTLADEPAAPKVKEVLEQQDQAEEKGEPLETHVAEGSVDDYDRGTPRSSIRGLADALRRGDYARAVHYLDLRNLPSGLDASQGQELARQLRIIAERTLWVDFDTLSDDPRGHQDDGLPPYRDRIVRIDTPTGPVEFWAQHLPRADGDRIWKISNRTLARVPDLYQQYGYGRLGDWLSRLLPEYRFLGLYVWQWAVLMVVLVAAYLVAWVVTLPMILLLRRRGTPRSERRQRFVSGPLRFVILVLVVRSSFDLVAPTLEARAWFEAKTLLILAVAWLLMGGVDLLLGQFGDRMRRGGQEQATVLLRPAATLVKIVVLIFAVVLWLDNLGFEVTTLLAGLGVGSVAVALAAQKTLENFVGAVTLYASQPVRVGDFCRFGDKLGTVEEIGLRSTLVRTIDRTVVNVPNATFSSIDLENFTERDRILYRTRLRLRANTTPGQVRYILVEVRKLLYSHPKIHSDPARVRFVEFGEHSIDLEVFTYITTTDYNRYLGIVEDVNLRMMDIIWKAGSRLALPAQTLYMERGEDGDDERARAAEAKVKAWRTQGSLYLPDVPEEKRAALQGSLDFPPEGSPDATH